MSVTAIGHYEPVVRKTGVDLTPVQIMHERIRVDIVNEQRGRSCDGANKEAMRSQWEDKLDCVAAIKKEQFGIVQAKTDIKLMRDATKLVRQSAMQQQIADDYKRYEQELRSSGKAFYIKRE